MRRHFLLFLVLLLAAGSCFLTYSVLAQGGLITRSVGTPSCEPFNDQQGNRCYRLNCNPNPDSYSNYDSCDGRDINSSLYGVQLCEIPPGNGTIDEDGHIRCQTGPPASKLDILFMDRKFRRPAGHASRHDMSTQLQKM